MLTDNIYSSNPVIVRGSDSLVDSTTKKIKYEITTTRVFISF